MTATSQRLPSRMRQLWLFARNFVKHPKMLGSLIPSSRFLVRRMLREIDWSRATVLVEYGPGVGVFTAEMLRRMRPDATLIVFETNQEFVDFLRHSIKDARLRVVHGSAAEVLHHLEQAGHAHADYIVSGIPYSTMPAEVRDAILSASHRVLRPGGKFLVYQFSRASLPYVRRVFPRVWVALEPLNIPPATAYICQV
ncbi:MAG TPA: methyltransferase domain-containing protein [Herpetosiphonaceae bacterium]|nr:methyltransferase domain-containing protein [Herpetosiphonaceae bacterium]